MLSFILKLLLMVEFLFEKLIIMSIIYNLIIHVLYYDFKIILADQDHIKN